MNENRIMEPVTVVQRRGSEVREKDGGGDLIKIYGRHMCKCHNVFPWYNYQMLI
jgi:hypothetical protein